VVDPAARQQQDALLVHPKPLRVDALAFGLVRVVTQLIPTGRVPLDVTRTGWTVVKLDSVLETVAFRAMAPNLTACTPAVRLTLARKASRASRENWIGPSTMGNLVHGRAVVQEPMAKVKDTSPVSASI